MNYEQTVEMLSAHLSGGVTDGSGKTWTFTPRGFRYGRKWMTKRAQRWKRGHQFDFRSFTVEVGR